MQPYRCRAGRGPLGAGCGPGPGQGLPAGTLHQGKPCWANELPAQPSLATCPLQYHINKLSQSGEVDEPAGTDSGLDDLDAALSNLEVKLEGSAPTDMLVRRGSSQGLGSGLSAGSGWPP